MALPDSASCTPRLVTHSLSLSLSLSLPRRLGPIKAGLMCLLSLSLTPFILRVSPGSCRGWTAAGHSPWGHKGQTQLNDLRYTHAHSYWKSHFFFFLQNIKGLHLFSQGSLLIIWYLNHPLIKLKLCPRPTRMKACIFCRMCNFTSLQSICIWFALYCWPRGSVQQRSWCLVWGSTHQHNGKLLNVN